MKCFIPLLLALSTAAASTQVKDDVIFKALIDEMDRSIQRLRLDGHQTPYYLSYTVRDTDSFKAQSSFGALTERDRAHHRNLAVDLRVGDYKVDSSSPTTSQSFDFGSLMRHSGHTSSLSVDDDYNAIRHKLWLSTDSAYKQAVESLEANKRYLKDNNIVDRPDSFSKEAPVVLIDPPAHLDVSMDMWTANVRKVSAVFREYERVRRSNVMFGAQAYTRWFVNNEGSKNRIGETAFMLSMDATAQAADGMKIADQELVAAYTEKEMPGLDELQAKAKKLAERLTKLSAAPIVDDYRGPILFEGEAAAQFFHQMLDAKLTGPRSNPFQQMLGGENTEKLGQRILPSFISIVDDPAATEFKGEKLFGTYKVDDDGVRAQKILLVDKGILKTFCMSRVPNKQVSKSNGHSRFGLGATSNLFIQSDSKLSSAELKAKLIAEGKEDGLAEVYIVRRIIMNPLDLGVGGMRSLLKSLMPGGGGVALYPPVLLYKVSVADGHEELVRGAQFNNLTARILRDVDATGDDDSAYPVMRGEDLISVVTPSVLVREMEIQKPERANSKPPILKNPYFD